MFLWHWTALKAQKQYHSSTKSHSNKAGRRANPLSSLATWAEVEVRRETGVAFRTHMGYGKLNDSVFHSFWMILNAFSQ